MTTTTAIFAGFSITCLLVLLLSIIVSVSEKTKVYIVFALAFLATWAVITLGLMRWM